MSIFPPSLFHSPGSNEYLLALLPDLVCGGWRRGSIYSRNAIEKWLERHGDVVFASSATKMLVVFNLTSGSKGCERVNGSHVFRGEKFKQRGAFGWPNFHEQTSIDFEIIHCSSCSNCILGCFATLLF